MENEARDSRAPIDLVAVIDRSGSMTYGGREGRRGEERRGEETEKTESNLLFSGEKIELVLQTMAFVVEQLKDADQLCLIAYLFFYSISPFICLFYLSVFITTLIHGGMTPMLRSCFH